MHTHTCATMCVWAAGSCTRVCLQQVNDENETSWRDKGIMAALECSKLLGELESNKKTSRQGYRETGRRREIARQDECWMVARRWRRRRTKCNATECISTVCVFCTHFSTIFMYCAFLFAPPYSTDVANAVTPAVVVNLLRHTCPSLFIFFVTSQWCTTFAGKVVK